MINCLCSKCENIDTSAYGLHCMILGNNYEDNKKSCKDYEPISNHCKDCSIEGGIPSCNTCIVAKRLES